MTDYIELIFTGIGNGFLYFLLIWAGFAIALLSQYIRGKREAPNICSDKRPPRHVFCQLDRSHQGECRSVIYWKKVSKK